MIKVIASDMDGTLLDENHMLTARTAEAIKKAQAAGIRFIIATGRGYVSAMPLLREVGIECDYLVSSGAEVRNSKEEVIQRNVMKKEDYIMAYQTLEKYDLIYTFETDENSCFIGSEELLEENMLQHMKVFYKTMSEEDIRKLPFFYLVMSRCRAFSSFEELEAANLEVTKIFSMSNDLELLNKISAELGENKGLAVSSSFVDNLEITDINAQKGIALKSYIESLGYTMDEVMVFGDSMNDYSMLAMDFGATVAMENAVDEIKAAVKYITKSNEEDGVAYAIEELLKSREGGAL